MPAGGAAQAQLPPPELPPLAGTPVPVARLEVGAPAVRPAGAVAGSPLAQRPSTAVFIETSAGKGEIQQNGQVSRSAPATDDSFIFTVATELPGPDRIFRRQSESEFLQRIREESRGKAHARVIFPENPPLTSESYQRRSFPPMVESVEPSYVCHGRLLFEQPNFERQGWNLSVLTPLVNLGVFYYDVALLPYHAATRPFQQTDCSAGKCLPGDPTPLYLYREEFSVSGLVGQAAVVTGLFYLFP